MKEFTSVLSMRSEQQQEILAQLREAYDGQYKKIFGNGKVIDWKGQFGLIAACTPVYDKHYAVIGSMGERFLLYRSDDPNGIEMGLRACKFVGQEEKMRTEFKCAFHRFIDQFDNISMADVTLGDTVTQNIVHLACFIAYARCPVERDYHKAILYQPLPEGTARLTKQFVQLGMGLALVHAKKEIDDDIYQIVKKIARDLVPVQRLKIFEYLYEWEASDTDDPEQWRRTTDICKAVNIPYKTAKYLLEDLMVVGAVQRDTEEELEKTVYIWKLTSKVVNWMSASQILRH